MSPRRVVPRRKGRVSREKRMEQREARTAQVVAAIARRRAETLTIEDLDRIPEDIRYAVEVVSERPWVDFVDRVKDVVESRRNADTIVELPGSTDEGPAPVRG